ncbi:MAG: hypothetical protein JWQ83_491 [Lacunisphaera sp.]|nr:hypothetical protein [Lacunisphaera sp.]
MIGTSIEIAPFRFDVTPPLGHSLCAGFIMPVIGYDDPLEAIGYVLRGCGAPVVVCAVDWLGLGNEAHAAWRTALANAAGTSPDRVAVQTVHQHNAPLVCFEAARLVAAQPDLPPMFDRNFFATCLDRAQSAVRTALSHFRRVTHLARGQAPVKKVAANRRVARDAQGRVVAMRRTMCTDPVLIALPEGLIDPMLKTVAFYDGDTKVVACHYYATHPMSYYADGRVSSDFCGLARRQRQDDEPGCTHIYFTGCGANLGAGKYNDGSPAARKLLTRRMYEAIVASEAKLLRQPLRQAEWRTCSIMPEPNPTWTEADLKRLLAAKAGGNVERILAALKLAWIGRFRRQAPLTLSALQLDDISMLHLPAEVFVEYQLRAQQMGRDRFVAVAAYGDDGPFYIPTREEYACGGYEVGVAFCSDGIDQLLTEGIRELLG